MRKINDFYEKFFFHKLNLAGIWLKIFDKFQSIRFPLFHSKFTQNLLVNSRYLYKLNTRFNFSEILFLSSSRFTRDSRLFYCKFVRNLFVI